MRYISNLNNNTIKDLTQIVKNDLIKKMGA